MSSLQSVQAKLSELADEIKGIRENRQRLEDKVLKLQEDNVELKKEIFNNEKENHNLKQKLVDMEKAVRQHRLEIKQIKKLTSDLATQTEGTKKTDNLDKKIHDLEEKNKKLEKSNKIIIQENATLTSKVDTVEKTVDTLSGFQRVVNRTLVDKHNRPDLEKQVDELKTRTGQLEMRNKNIIETMTDVRLTKQGNYLITGQQVKLDKCVADKKGIMDTRECNLVYPRDGRCAFLLNFGQYGPGVVKIHLKWEECQHEEESYVGQTRGDGDTSCCFWIGDFKKGTKVWVVAERVEGEAIVGWCNFFSWFVDE